MKFRLALLAVMVASAAPLAAQGGRGFFGGNAITIDNLSSLYKLSGDQKKATKVLVDDYDKSAFPLQDYIRSQRNDGAIVSPDSTKRQQQLRDDFNAKFKALLDPKQVKKFDSVQAAQPVVRGG